MVKDGTTEAVAGIIQMQRGENAREVVTNIKAKVSDINKRRLLPEGLQIVPFYDRTDLVDAALFNVAKVLLEGILLVIIVLYVYLGDARSSIIVTATLLLTPLLTFMVMNYYGLSANLMSLGGLAIAIGIMVDGSVVVVENTFARLGQRMNDGVSKIRIVLDAASEVGKPVLFGVGIIILVFMPLLSLQGMEGKMFAPMAITVMLALAAAFILSVTFVPAMVAVLIRGKVAEKDVAFVAWIKRIYAPVLDRSVAHPWPFIAGAVGIFALAGIVFAQIGSEFMPKLDERDMVLASFRPPSTPIETSLEMQRGVERELIKLPEVAMVLGKTGTAEIATDPMPPYLSDGIVILKPKDQWPAGVTTKAQVIERIEAQAKNAIGNGFESSQPIEMRFNELIAGVRGDVAVKLYGDDLDKLGVAARQIAAAFEATPGAADVRVEQTAGAPVLDLRFDRVAIARLGLTVEDVADTVSVALAGGEAGLVFEGDRRFDIVVRVPEAARNNLDALGALPVLLPEVSGQIRRSVPLAQVAQFRFVEGLNQISREDGKRRVVIQANVRGRDVGSFVAEARPKVEAVALPTGSWLTWGGQYENLQAATARLTIIVPIAFLAIFGLLFMALGSVTRALAVFTAVPLSLAGGVFALALTGIPFSVSAAVGFICLSGVAVLNGLVVMSSIGQRLDDGVERITAIVDGCFERVRPVLMTGLVPAIGFVPMAIASGTGAEVQKPLAIVVIGGLISATILTLLVLPAITKVLVRAPVRHDPEAEPLSIVPLAGAPA